MNKTYGRALSAFRKINRIKSATQKIDEAKVKIFEQQQIAKQKAEDLLNEKTLVSNAFDLAITGLTSLGLHTNFFNEGNAKKVAAGASVLKDVITDLAYNKPEDRKSIMAGLGSKYGDFKSNMSSQAETLANAINQYTLFDELEKQRKLDFFNKEFESMSNEDVYNTYGISKDEMRNFMKENIEYEKGKGYSIDKIGAIFDLLQKDVELNLISDEERKNIMSPIYLNSISDEFKNNFDAFKEYAKKRNSNKTY